MRVRFGECVLDSETRQLSVGGEIVHLSPKAFQFLELLVESRPKALSKNEIHERLWPGTFVSDGTLASLLVEVRSATGDSARDSRFVRTVHRFGYAFCAQPGPPPREAAPWRHSNFVPMGVLPTRIATTSAATATPKAVASGRQSSRSRYRGGGELL